ncbi:carbohydrate-binding family V/XII [Inquilinus limosus]|uniref:Carbohydrate-binding family V/XII n=2 Tax=Inquilinus limosus TaxID=171674 RepID=A0A211ZTZ4_9PROT|nr:carbohydrate-binding family V/XII [Inquilinus limosus]
MGVLAIGLLALGWPYPDARAQAPADSVTALSWPRDFDQGGQRVEIYQPQIEDWSGDRLSGRAAIAIGAKGGQPVYGVARFSADTDIDKTAGLVRLHGIAIDGVEVPTAPDKAPELQKALQARLPADGMTVTLDHLQTSYAAQQQIAKQAGVPVRNDPPKIVFASAPTVLVSIDGDPLLHPVDGAAGYQRVVNARALILQEDKTFHVQAAGAWYAASTLDGTWVVTAAPPAALQAAAKAAVRSVAPDPLLPEDGKPPATPPSLLVVTQPTELVVTSGPPQVAPVAGVGLLTMTNADHAVFVDPSTNGTYVLVSGRWFRSTGLDGPWSFVPPDSLPADFAKIPPDDPKADVLVSVAGTPQAKEAVIAASIPQTATVSRSKAGLQVSYAGGAPEFEPIQGTPLAYAVNTPVPVIRVDAEHYYAVSKGVWFVALVPAGPWRVADAVPAVIYTIPASSPLHYATYVRIYSATPEIVVAGYTPGYLGVVVDPASTVVYGTGYAYPAYVSGDVWYGYPATYGYGAGFGLGAATGFAFGFAAGALWGSASPYWGPYWGYDGGYVNWSHVDVNQVNVYGRWGAGTVTHASGWNGWTDTSWSGSHVSGFNPYTGAHGQAGRAGAFDWDTGGYAAGRQGSFANPSTGVAVAGRAGITGNVDTGDYQAGRQVAGVNAQTGRIGAAQTTVTGNVRDGDRSVDSTGAVINPRTDSGMAWNDGNVYAGHDGNVYQHTDDGWQKHGSDGWQPVQRNSDELGGLDGQRQARGLGQQRLERSEAGGRFGGGIRRRR